MRTLLVLAFACLSSTAFAAMPAAEQNALVKRYCAVCHTDASKNGGLSLEHYDAAKRDPTLAAMMLSKLNNGAMGAAGAGVPEKAAQQAWLESTREQAVGAMAWFVNRENGVLTASIVRQVPSRNPSSTDAPVYRVKIACDASAGSGEMQLSWAPSPQTGLTMTASADDSVPIGYTIDGHESMGNGAAVQSGHASAILSGGKGAKLSFPKQSLTIRDLFPDETIAFPVGDLDEKVRSELRACF